MNNKQIGGSVNTQKARLFNAAKAFGLAFVEALGTSSMRNLVLSTAKLRYERISDNRQMLSLGESDLHFLARFKAYEEEVNKEHPNAEKIERLIDDLDKEYTLVRTNVTPRSELSEVVVGTLTEVTHAFLGQRQVEDINAKDALQFLQYDLIRKTDSLNHVADYELQNV